MELFLKIELELEDDELGLEVKEEFVIEEDYEKLEQVKIFLREMLGDGHLSEVIQNSIKD